MNPLADIRQYSPTMTISQLMKFCDKKKIFITRAMIQNYIRVGLLPPPLNKRIYTHKHLAAMVMIERLKPAFEIYEIKDALSPYMDEEGLPLDAYENLLRKIDSLTRGFLESNAQDLRAEKDGGTLLVMACAAEIKDIIFRGGDL